MQRRSIEGTPIDMEPERALYSKCNSTERNEIISAGLDWALRIMELVRRSVEWHAKRVVKVSYCDNLDIEEIRIKLKSVA